MATEECECLRGGAGDTVFMPTFAGNCPYVLSVGATELNRGSSNSTPSAHERPLHEVASVRPHLQRRRLQQRVSYSRLPEEGSAAVPGHCGPRPTVYGVRAAGKGRRLHRRPSAVACTAASAAGSPTSLLWGIGPSWYRAESVTLLKYAHPEVSNVIIEGSNPGCNSTGFTAAKG
ncbi:hypothetical protein CH063_11850 [Colletotrichum higginsianum]|uniref:Uncharacterized protein n=1 Tax=Colletotrichum higginsianum (strain IMI 349063) TaxID=759273 RepID=H1VN22_COLHI|nr:hypothetical protein CH063_11850 [Colletotrichum higginsianum]